MNFRKIKKDQKGISKLALIIPMPFIAMILFIVIFFVIIVGLLGGGLKNNDDEDEGEHEIKRIETSIVDKGDLQYMKDDSYFCYPISKTTGTSAQFGESGRNWSSIHTGLDFLGVMGEAKVVAVARGKVYSVSHTGSYGNHIIIEHEIEGEDGIKTPKFYTMYCHLASVAVNEGDQVMQGQVLGMMGATGNVTGPHCHFEFSFNPKMYLTSQDPMIWVFDDELIFTKNNVGNPIKDSDMEQE